MSLIPSAKGRHQRVFSKAGAESELHVESLLWRLCEEQLEGGQAPAGIQAQVVPGLGLGHWKK